MNNCWKLGWEDRCRDAEEKKKLVLDIEFTEIWYMLILCVESYKSSERCVWLFVKIKSLHNMKSQNI